MTTTDSIFDDLKSALADSIAYSKGKLSLKTTDLPAPPPPASAADVRKLRRRLHMSQAIFAATINVSTKTVQSWEQGVRQPSDAALRILQVVRTSPQIVATFYAHAKPSKGRRTRRASA